MELPNPESCWVMRNSRRIPWKCRCFIRIRRVYRENLCKTGVVPRKIASLSSLVSEADTEDERFFYAFIPNLCRQNKLYFTF